MRKGPSFTVKFGGQDKPCLCIEFERIVTKREFLAFCKASKEWKNMERSEIQHIGPDADEFVASISLTFHNIVDPKELPLEVRYFSGFEERPKRKSVWDRLRDPAV